MARPLQALRDWGSPRIIGALTIALLVVALAACDKRSEQAHRGDAATDRDADAADGGEKSGGIEYADGPAPEPDTVLAEAHGITVTLADYRQSLRRSLLVTPDGVDRLPKERLAMPQFQLGVVRNLVRSKIIEREAKRRDLEVNHEDKLEAVSAHPSLKPLADILEERDEDAKKLTEHDLKLEDLDDMAAEVAYEEELRQALLDEIDEEAVWETWRRDHDRFEVLLVTTRNSPDGDELDAFIDSHPDRIERHFEEHSDEYRNPRMVRLLRLIPDDDGGDGEPDREVFDEAAQRLGEGEDPDKIADDLGLRVDENALMVREENPRAYRSKEGAAGVKMGRPRGPYAWRVEGFREPDEPELDGAIRREIAAELMRRDRIVPSRGEAIEEAIEAIEELPTDEQGRVEDDAVDALKKRLEDEGLRVVHTDMFARNERGVLPGVGLAEEVAERVWDLSLDEPTVDEPILSRDRVFAVRLLDRQRPDRERFEEDKEAFANKLRDRLEGRIVDDFVSGYQDEHEVDYDLNPLRVEYGTLRKK